MRGGWPVARFARVLDVLASEAGELDCAIEGARDESGRPGLRVRVSGVLQVACQRCLAAMQYPLQIDTLLLLARSEAEIEARPLEPEGPDSVVAGKEMDVAALLEEEILLAIPLAPRHEQCSGNGAGMGEAQASPFAGLRARLHRGGAKN